MATEHGSFDVAEKLIRAGADVDTKDKVSIIHCMDYSICHTIPRYLEKQSYTILMLYDCVGLT